MSSPQLTTSLDAHNSAVAGSRHGYTRAYLKWLRPHAASVVSLICVALAVTVLQLTQPLCMRYVIDRVLLNPRLDSADRLARLNLISITFLAVVSLAAVLGLVRDYWQRLLSARLTLELRGGLFEKLLHLPLATLEQMKMGGILARLTSGVDAATGLLQMAIISPSISAARLVIAVAILFALNPRLALLALAIVPGVVVLSIFHATRVRPLYGVMRRDIELADARAAETFSGIRVVRAFRREARELLKYAKERHAVARTELFATRREVLHWTSWTAVLGSIPILTAWYGGHLFLAGVTSIGDLMAFQWYGLMLLDPVWQIVQSISELQRSLAATERTFDVLAMPNDKADCPEPSDTPNTVREILFEGVEFEYHSGIPVLRQFDLAVPAGTVVALVGRSGSGKSTMTDLVARFHDPTRGRILLNGVDIRRFRLDSYRRLLAVVPQEVFLFDGSVRENVAYGKRHASEREIEDAARLANAHEFIMKLPQQYATVVGQRGAALSAGQRQRIAFARALLADPQILILDEATSNLDSESEQIIEMSIGPLLVGRTTFIVAHRLSTVRRADLILVIDEGRIVERGTHETLMSARGTYYAMVRRQADTNSCPIAHRTEA